MTRSLAKVAFWAAKSANITPAELDAALLIGAAGLLLLAIVLIVRLRR